MKNSFNCQDSNNSSGAAPLPVQRLVDVQGLAQILSVPKSWIYERTRQGIGAIPHVKLGAYVRFNPEEVIEFFKSKGVGYHNAS